jgi:ribosomal protection tetracycline resistance protein
VCEPIHRLRLEVPHGSLPAVLALITRLGGVPGPPAIERAAAVLEADLAAGRVHQLTRLLPGLTSGEGVVEASFDRHEPVRGPVPSRPRTGADPLDREEYLRRILRGAAQ